MQPCYLICGVSGSGKSWVCRQLKDKFLYVPRDEHFTDHLQVIKRACLTSEKPIITECPFSERVTRGSIEIHGIEVIPYFVVERPEVVAKRYYEREKKIIPQNALTRASTIINRAIEWGAPWGTSQQILDELKAI